MNRHPVRSAFARAVSEGWPVLRGFDGRAQFRHLKDLEGSSPERVRAWHRERLAERLPWWCERVPFYRAHLADEAARLGRAPAELIDEMLDAVDLRHLPLQDKATIRAAGADLEVEGVDRRGVRRNHTGGSTGEVLHFLQNVEDSRWLMAGIRLFRSYMGLDMGARTAQIWGSPIGLSKAKSLRSSLGRWLLHSQFHSTYDLDAARRREIVSALHRFGPELLIGYPSSLCAFLPELEELPQGAFPDLRGIWTASETLLPSHREDLQRVFGAPVFNNYGCREFGPLAMECQAHEGLHLNEGCYFFEFLPVGGGLKEIVVTDLKNQVMPLIRYRIGDLATGDPRPCSCGRAYRVLPGLEGRRFDLVRGPKGETVTGTFWTLLLRSRPGVQRFQVVQEDWLRFRILLETDERFDPACLEGWRERIQAQFADPVAVDFRLDEEIQALPSGKFRFIQSLVAAKGPLPEDLP